jgi:copper chaperone
MKSVRLKVEGMTCELCVLAIEKSVQEKGAKGKADLAKGTVTVEYDENHSSLESIKDEIEEHGYKVGILYPENHNQCMEVLNMSIWAYFTPDQQEKMKRNMERLSSEDVKKIRKEADDVIAKIRLAMEQGTLAKEQQVVQLAERLKESNDIFNEGDPEIEQATARFYDENPGLDMHGIDRKFYKYYQQALSHSSKERR